MNKLMTTALVAGGLMLLNSPEATAHKEVRNVYEPPAYYDTYRHVEYRRSTHMPRWLKRNHSFRKWYQHTRLRRDRRLAWDQLYDIYRFERRWGMSYHRSDDFWVDYYRYRYRDHDQRDRHRPKRRHY